MILHTRRRCPECGTRTCDCCGAAIVEGGVGAIAFVCVLAAVCAFAGAGLFYVLVRWWG